VTRPDETADDRPGGRVYVQRASAAGGSVVVQVGGNLYVSDASLAAMWTTETTPGECPYPGLESFGPGQAKWFFGRKKLSDDLVDVLDTCLRAGNGGPVVVVGPSGAGKSSLLGAGLLTALREGRLPAGGSADWPAVTLTPGTRPLDTLARSLSACAAALTGQEAASLTGWEAALASLRSAGQRVVIVVDQMEEVFTACADEAERQAFLGALETIAAPDADGAAGLVVTGLRADFYARATGYPVVRAALQTSQLVIGAMTAGEVRQAITRPALAVGLMVDGELTERLLRDLGAGDEPGGTGYEPGRLPLLAYALRATWRRREGDRLTIGGYEASGGIRGAVAKAADDMYDRLDDAGQRVARQLFLRLVRVGESGSEGSADTRRRVSRENLCSRASDPAAALAVVEAFTAARLLTAGGETVEITHDALLRSWPRLRDWIEQDRSGHLIRQSLEDAASTWDREGRDPSGLYGGVRLAAAHAWADDPARPRDLSPVARDFLSASDHRRRRGARRRNGVIAVLAALAVVLAGLTGYAFNERAAAQSRYLLAEASVFTDQANAALTTHDLGSAMEFAIQAERLNPQSAPARDLLLNMQSQQFIGKLNPDVGQVAGVAFSPDGSTIATAIGVDGSLRFWDTATRAQVAVRMPDPGHRVDCVAFSPAGRLLASGQPGGIHLWNVADRAHPESLGVLPVPGDVQIQRVTFAPDGRLLAAGDVNGRVWMWRAADRSLVTAFAVHPGRAPVVLGVPQTMVEGLTFTPDGTALVAATIGGTVRVWDIRNGRSAGTIPNGNSNSSGLAAVSPDGRILAITTGAGHNPTATQLWDLASRKLIRTLPSDPADIAGLSFGSDGTLLAVGDDAGAVRLWAVKNGKLAATLTGHTEPISELAFSADGKILASADADGTVGLWNVPGNTIGGYGPANAIALNPSGTLLAVSPVSGGAVRVTLYSMPGRQIVASLVSAVAGARFASALAFSPDGRLLAAATGDPNRTVLLWNVASRRLVGDIATHHINLIYALAFSPDGRLLATSGIQDPVVKLWDPRTGTLVASLPGNVGSPELPNILPGVWALAFSPDGRTLAAAGADGEIRLWSTTRHVQVMKPIQQLDTLTTFSVAFSPDGSTLAIGNGDGSIAVQKLLPGSLPQYLHGDNQAIQNLAFTRDGKTLVTASEDGDVRLWPTPSWSTPVTLTASTKSLSGMAVSPDGSIIVTRDSTSVRLWDTDPVRVATGICETLRTPVSPNLWKQYELPPFPYTPICR
jgi:WD40 repeat protein